jgi:hypothetical protein
MFLCEPRKAKNNFLFFHTSSKEQKFLRKVDSYFRPNLNVKTSSLHKNVRLLDGTVKFFTEKIQKTFYNFFIGAEDEAVFILQKHLLYK